MKESAAEGLTAGSDCGLPDNFIHFTGRSKPSELHDSDGELSLKLATLLEVRVFTTCTWKACTYNMWHAEQTSWRFT